jgi:hypothetical protein
MFVNFLFTGNFEICHRNLFWGQAGARKLCNRVQWEHCVLPTPRINAIGEKGQPQNCQPNSCNSCLRIILVCQNNQNQFSCLSSSAAEQPMHSAQTKITLISSLLFKYIQSLCGIDLVLDISKYFFLFFRSFNNKKKTTKYAFNWI